MTTNTYVLSLSCADTTGIVAAVTGYLSGLGIFITESANFGDPETGGFFQRTVFRTTPGQPSIAEIEAGFRDIAHRFGMRYRFHDTAVKPRVLIMVSKFDHCLNDLLYRYRTGSLPIDIPAVVSNHPDLARVVEWHGIPYHFLPVTKDTKAEQEAAVLEMVERLRIDLVVLARYMQVLSDHMCKALSWRCINIHHSFLPSFKGARPYHQAHARGVKIIGATAHYVTADLDEGPIIEQGVERIDHTFTPEDFVSIGRDIESVVLARAVQFHVEHRVIPNGSKTVVFRR
ncbi:formyltetrahydrofolate deformylase [Rhodoplanes serenus]|jgi:formyltetrahydrofolate deformylase|uniref:Formyltetrahydrofolate deformylase n=1 Tax=Rhodoplanes serenus TaxID=200615 RepID=A0A327K5A4_9BRAD|nr:formyltetrahydrofolate deformylase [Rhodoplanes serenus]MBI5111702.1 formyltetrahydrofolate deformylase [Rhodovulum sp.]MTW16595.1 formyltetrahydrofolate deformylase [Rhodoplanes serenus]RAI33577.1 formyltetrahydrofolate deformylase [Rhodoplanes serenus]VCU08564.1 Formyltetrahydrofolate deformylase [Rhodoplanes serenus]